MLTHKGEEGQVGFIELIPQWKFPSGERDITASQGVEPSLYSSQAKAKEIRKTAFNVRPRSMVVLAIIGSGVTKVPLLCLAGRQINDLTELPLVGRVRD